MKKELKQIIIESLDKAFHNFEEDYGLATYEQDGQEYIKESSARECVEDFKSDFDAKDFIIEYLAENNDLMNAIHEIVEEKDF